MTDRILGTRVPDTPIHRASLWLEEVKFPVNRPEAEIQEMDQRAVQRFLDQTDAQYTEEQLHEAVEFYGLNNLRMLTGGRIEMTIPSPTGKGHIYLRDIFASLWLDAFMHGVATAQGKSGLSNDEIRAEDMLGEQP